MASGNNPFLHTQAFPTEEYVQPSVSSLPSLPEWVPIRAKALKIILVIELILTVWIFFYFLSMMVLLIVPANIVGFYGCHRLRTRALAAFAFMKTLVLCLVTFFLCSLVITWSHCTNCGSMDGEIPTLTIMLVLVGILQLSSIVSANRIRRAIIAAESRPASNVELSRVDAGMPSPNPPSPHVPQNVPVYPYPYPVSYMAPSGTQAYPPMPYVYGYPSDGTQEQHPMPVVYPTYIYPGAQHTEQAYPNTYPSNSDSDALLQNVNLNEK